jgi:hypothetical protein
MQIKLDPYKKALLSTSLVFICIFGALSMISSGVDSPFLSSEKGATWIYIDRPFLLEAQREGDRVSYKKYFTMENGPSRAALVVRSMRVSEVYLDGTRLVPVEFKLARWKGMKKFDLSGLLTPGKHEMLIRVYNKNGPAALLAYSDAMKLFTGTDWQASYDELLWTRAASADKKKETPELSRRFITTDKALITLLPLYVPLFLAVFLLTMIAASPGSMGETIKRFFPPPSGVRWLLIILWGILAINNILKVYIDIGMDVQQHYEYIEYIDRLGKIPLAPEGWQMFQSPLYYLISAALWHFSLSRWFDTPTAMLLLRIIPLLCGLLQVELAYRATKTVFPQRQDLQIWGTIVGGLLPMNLYISQVVGNEPLSGLLSACALVMGFVMLTSEREALPEWYFAFMGLAVGLSLLTKVTAVLLILPSAILLIYALHDRGRSPGYTCVRGLEVIGIVIAVSGWYYLRNWIELGRPFVGGWESTVWWQDPGYRTVSDFLSFGKSIITPIYSAVQGFWDSIYSTLWLDGSLSGTGIYKFRPPWHYNFMLSGALLSLVPTAGILLGILTTISRPFRRAYRAQLISVFCIGIYFAALLYMYLTVPVYSTAKATYTLGLIPCYAVLTVTGLDLVSRNRLARAAVNGCLACWAVAAYCSYFVV